MSEKIAVYPGTFDPVTLGHLDVLKRASRVFDKIIVAVTTNPGKKPLFSLKERIEILKKSTEKMPFVEIESFSGLLVEYLKKKRVSIILRGLREMSDFEFEFQQASVNRKLSKDIDTFFVMTSEKYYYVSSSIVREVASLGGNVSCFVPKPAAKALKEKFKQSVLQT